MKNGSWSSEETVLFFTAVGDCKTNGKLFAVKRVFVERFLNIPAAFGSRIYDDFVENYSLMESRLIYENARRKGAILSEMSI